MTGRSHLSSLALTAGIAVGCLLAIPAAAHDFWIEPSRYLVEAGQRVAVRLFIGEHFRGNPYSRNRDHIVRFVIKGLKTEMPVRGVHGVDPAGFVTVEAPGLYAIGYESHPSRVELDAEKFQRYLKMEGLESISELRRRRGESEQGVSELFYRCAKSLIRVGPVPAHPPTPPPLGLPLELLFDGDPTRIAVGGKLSVRLLWQGEPLAGALVMGYALPATEDPSAARTNEAGRANLPLPYPGPWLIKAVHMEPAPAGTGADWQSWWASLTFELLD